MTTLVWTCPQQAEVQFCQLRETAAARQISGLVFSVYQGWPLTVSYRLMADRQWRTRRVTVQQDYRGELRSLELEVDEEAGWFAAGAEIEALRGCLDIDLGVTPATNLLPLRRLSMKADESRTVQAAWLQFPALSLTPAAQQYTRLDENRYRYSSGDFTAELLLDADGFVQRYGELWQLLGRTDSDHLPSE